MSLLEKKSLYDRNSRGTLGTNIGTNAPSQGNYYAEDGQNMNSPFVTKDGPVDDHLKALLEKDIASVNTGVTYFKSPNQSPFQDLNTSADPTTYSGQLANPNNGQFGGPYKNVGPTDGFY